VERGAGDGHVFANAILMIVMAVAGLYVAVSVPIRYFFGDLRPYLVDTNHPVAWVGAFGIWGAAVGDAAWASVNAWGLFTRKGWARTSSIAFWCAASVACCCLPGGGYGVWSLTRPEVKRAFDGSIRGWPAGHGVQK
jgi:hypothetical protein